jgi:hypothetical protein
MAKAKSAIHLPLPLPLPLPLTLTLTLCAVRVHRRSSWSPCPRTKVLFGILKRLQALLWTPGLFPDSPRSLRRCISSKAGGESAGIFDVSVGLFRPRGEPEAITSPKKPGKDDLAVIPASGVAIALERGGGKGGGGSVRKGTMMVMDNGAVVVKLADKSLVPLRTFLSSTGRAK